MLKIREVHSRLSTREISFQQGVDGYKGTVRYRDLGVAVKTILNANPNASSDADNDGGESQVLMRFDDIFGNGERQNPPNSTIVSAKLIVAAFDQGSTVNLHRCFSIRQSATWDSMITVFSRRSRGLVTKMVSRWKDRG